MLGFAACVHGSIEHECSADDGRNLSGALCISFDSESLGQAGALARVFTRVRV